MTEPMPVLITCAGGTMVPSALRWLQANSRIPLEVHGGDAGEAPLAKPFLDAFHSLPNGDDPNYASAVLAIVRRHSIKVIVPWSDGEAFALAAAGSELAGADCALTTSPAAVLETLRDKVATYHALESAGVPVPHHAVVSTPAGIDDALKEFGFPDRTVVVKPADGRGGRGVCVLIGADGAGDWMGAGQRERRIDAVTFETVDRSELVSGETLIMPALGAPVYDVDVLAQGGRTKVAVVRERHNLAGIPWTGNTICRNPAFESYARDAAQALGLDGTHDLDLMSDEDGNPALLEVNPRMSGSLAATLAAGIPLLDAAIAACVGQELPVDLPDKDVDVVPYTEALAL